MRKSSVHFKQVANASVSIAHSTRTEEKEPAYLLPKEHRLGNVIVPGSMSNIDLGLEFTRAKDSMTGQAKARGSSPFWEGVVVLDGTGFKAQTASLQSWKKEYEKATGQRVLHMAIHGDEGFINSAGKPEYNIHAHVIVNRLNDKGRVIKLGRKQLSEVQDLTAKSLGMQRGETLEDRNFMRGRKHLNHREFKAQANEKRLDAEHNIGAIQTEKSRTDHIRGLFQADTKIIDDLKAQIAKIEADYKAERETMKASGDAKQAGYQRVKKERDTAIATLKLAIKKIEETEQKVTDLEAEAVQAQDHITQQVNALAKLKADAMAVITPLRTEVKNMKTQITQLNDENMGMKWWNDLEPWDRAKWMKQAGDTGVAADAWGAFKSSQAPVVADKTELSTEAAKAAHYQAELAKGTPAHLIVPSSPAPSTPTRGAKPGLPGEKAVTPSGLHGPRAIEQPQGPVVDVALAAATKAQWDAALAAERVLYLKELTADAHTRTVAGVAQHQAHLDSKPMLLGRDKWEDQRQRFENRDTSNNLEWKNLKDGAYPFLERDKEAVQKAVERRLSDKNPALAREVPKAVETLLEARRQDAALERGRLAQKLAERATQQLGKDKGVGR